MRLRYELKGIKNFPGSLSNIKSVYQNAPTDWEAADEQGFVYAIQFLCPNLFDTGISQQDYDPQIKNYLKKMQKNLDKIESFAKIAAQYAVFLCQTDDDDIQFSEANSLTVDEYYNAPSAEKSDNTLPVDDKSQSQFGDDSDDADIIDFVDSNTSEYGNTESWHTDENNSEAEFVKDDFFTDTDLQYLTTKTDYKIFKTDYDIEIHASKLASDAERIQLNKEFSLAQKNQGKTIQKLARKLRSRLVSVQNDCRYQDLYEGVLDYHKINKILIDPLDGRFFKDEVPIIAENTAITLLIDNSGSMRGKPITMAALCADIIAETVERCGAKVEILGFTTQNWRGGLARKDYEKAGCPPSPGRLNDLYHIIYKDFNESYKSAKRSIPVMLKESLLKENIDGEALQWAVKRLSKRLEPRKILIVISDGAPVDDSTNSANNAYYLENHLKKIIQIYENKSDIDVFAIGIGHDVKNYYKKAVTIPNSDALAEALTEKFVTLF
jgi:cobaltochelatase CobT